MWVLLANLGDTQRKSEKIQIDKRRKRNNKEKDKLCPILKRKGR